MRTRYSILVRGGTLIDPAAEIEGPMDLLLRDGRVAQVASPDTIRASADEIINATGMIVAPGFIDLHVHLRQPGQSHKETIATGTAAAVAGGFTSVCCMPNTNPVNDNQAITEFILDRARAAGAARVFPIGAITKGSDGKELAEIGDLRRAGCVAISDDGKPVMNSLIMRRAMEYALAFDLPIIDHCEDLHLSEGGCMNEGLVSTQLGLQGIPAAAEDIMVARNLALARLTGARLHLAHLSTAGSVRMVREAKANGIRLTAEACPHHFTLTEEAVRGFNTLAKMNPPLRGWDDVQAIKEGLRDGTIDVIATDHAPHAAQEKQQEFAAAPNGLIGLETAFPLTLALVEEGVLSLEAAVAKLTIGPAQAFSLDKGTLAPGADADVVIVDPAESWDIDPSRFRSKGRNSPFTGWKVKGKVYMTLVGGRLVYDLTA